MLFLSLQTVRYSGAWDNDVSLFRAAVAAVPNSTKANHKLGEELLRAGEVGQALPYLREALRIAPDNEFAAITLGQARREVARRYLPAEAGRPAPGPMPENPEILYTLGDLSRERGDTAAAVAYWERALALDPGHPPTLVEMGMLALSRGDTVQGEERLRNAVREDPGLAEAWYALGRIHLAHGDLAAARQALERFVDEARGRFPRQVVWARETLAHLP
jgi:tetratricopeptide (TPR) repeat protein